MNPKIKELKKQLEEEEQREEIRKAGLKFLCCCGKYHAIKDCEVVQTHWYTSPRGCCEGDYWNEGELQIICPKTSIRNRLLYHSYYDIPWDQRDEYKSNAEIQFKDNYKHLFKQVINEYEKEHRGNEIYQWQNNYYIDENRKKFGIILKYKKEVDVEE